VQWKHFSPEEATWELEGDLKKSHPMLFQESWKHRGQCFTEGGKDVTSPQNKYFYMLEIYFRFWQIRIWKIFAIFCNSKFQI
jgi:hypothetical protein